MSSYFLKTVFFPFNYMKIKVINQVKYFGSIISNDGSKHKNNLKAQTMAAVAKLRCIRKEKIIFLKLNKK